MIFSFSRHFGSVPQVCSGQLSYRVELLTDRAGEWGVTASGRPYRSQHLLEGPRVEPAVLVLVGEHQDTDARHEHQDKDTRHEIRTWAE